MVGTLSCGMGIVAYDGSPFAPSKDSLFDIIDAYGVTSFSLGPRYLQILKLAGLKPKKTHKLKSLKSCFSAGSVLTPETYEYIRSDIKDIFIANGSGGTDICGGFVGPCPILPVFQGVIQVPYLGINLECWDDNGNPLTNGEEGDMIVTTPTPNMPIAFLGDDENGTKYRSTYFEQYPGKSAWYQADFCQFGRINLKSP